MPAPSPKKRSVQGGGESDAGRLDRCDALEIQKLASLEIKNPGGTSDISAVIGPVQQGLPLNLGQLADCLAFSQALKCFKRSLSCDTMINNRRRVILAETNAGVCKFYRSGFPWGMNQ